MRNLFFLGAAALAVGPALLVSAALPERSAVNKGTAYIQASQQPDGGYGNGAAAGQVMDSIFAVRAAGFDPNKDVTGGHSPADYLKANAAAQNKPGSAGKAALAAKALGLDPKAVNGVNLIGVITGAFDAGTGRYGADDFTQSVAMLGLACTGNTVPAAAATALKTTQSTDGGWGFGGMSDPDTTAIALQALLATGAPKSDAAVTKAIAYFKATQGNDGGWGFDPNASNATSTAYVVQSLLAAGEPVESAAYSKNGVNPVAYLLTQQQADGSFIGFDPLFATNQVVPALAGRTFCNAPETAITQVKPAATPTATASAPATPSQTTTPAATVTVTPAAPHTGTGAAGSDDDSPVMLLAVAALLAGAGAFTAVTLRSRR